MKADSLTFRLAATSALWVAATLLAVGLLLVWLFRAHIERRFDSRLGDHMEELVAASEISPDTKRFRLVWTPTDPRFNRPYSGWYWQISRAGQIIARSKSLWKASLPEATGTGPANREIVPLTGPDEKKLRALRRIITLPDARQPFTFVIAGPRASIDRDVGLFTRQIALTLAILALALLAAIVIQVRYGLHPLRLLQRRIADIRSGRLQRLPARVPAEVTPVVTELNALLDQNSRMLEKARSQAANLAHALKNPLTVMSLEAGNLAGERGEILRHQTDIVRRHIERHLSRARAAGASPSRDLKTPLASILDDLQFSMQLLYQDKKLQFTRRGIADLYFRGDVHDAEEMLGNLFDNACKWARHRVKISGRHEGGRLTICFEDDGPGIAEKHIGDIMERGKRLDETVAGSGLGLDIVRDMAELHDGTLHLSRSAEGGLKAVLELPASPPLN